MNTTAPVIPPKVTIPPHNTMTNYVDPEHTERYAQFLSMFLIFDGFLFMLGCKMAVNRALRMVPGLKEVRWRSWS